MAGLRLLDVWRELLGKRERAMEAWSEYAEEVRTFEPASVSPKQRMEIAKELRKYFAEVDAACKPVSDAEAKDIIKEAMRSVRPGYRPHRGASSSTASLRHLAQCQWHRFNNLRCCSV